MDEKVMRGGVAPSLMEKFLGALSGLLGMALRRIGFPGSRRPVGYLSTVAGV